MLQLVITFYHRISCGTSAAKSSDSGACIVLIPMNTCYVALEIVSYALTEDAWDQKGRTAPRLVEVGVVPRCHVTTSRGLPRSCDSPEQR